jgi:hypothetical protein
MELNNFNPINASFEGSGQAKLNRLTVVADFSFYNRLLKGSLKSNFIFYTPMHFLRLRRKSS